MSRHAMIVCVTVACFPKYSEFFFVKFNDSEDYKLMTSKKMSLLIMALTV